MVKRRLTSILGTVAGIALVASFNNGGIEVRADPQTVRDGFAYVGLDDSSWIKPPPLPKVEYEVFDKVEGVVSELENAAVKGHTAIVEVLDSIDTAVEKAGDYMSNLELIPPMEGFYLPKEAESRYRLVKHHGEKRLLDKSRILQEKFGTFMKLKCMQYNTDYDLAHTILHIEGGNPNQVSHTGVKGIMQITGSTRKYIESHPKTLKMPEKISCKKNDENNIECGIALIAYLQEHYQRKFPNQNKHEINNHVLAAYNLGKGGYNQILKEQKVSRFFDIPEGAIRRETWRYVPKARAYSSVLKGNGIFNLNK
jgi:hypothetical protein